MSHGLRRKFRGFKVSEEENVTSPFSLIYGYEPCSYPALGKTFLPALEEYLSQLDSAQKEALAAHESAQRLMASHTTQHFHPWKVGDKVWLF